MASKYCKSLPAALIQHRIFTWCAAAVTIGLLLCKTLGVADLSCPFYEMTGRPCPGCGLTRSCLSLAQGEVAQSLQHHALGPVFVGIGSFCLLSSLLPKAVRGRLVAVIKRWDERLHFSGLLLTTLVIYAVVRMAGGR
jgi:hypothetical protein